MKTEALRDGDIIAGLEAGGTKCVAGVACLRGQGLPQILNRVSIPTTTPTETLAELREAYSNMTLTYGPIKAMGIGSFGPLILDPENSEYGALDSTPKPGWSGVNLIKALKVVTPNIVLNTDVNVAALAEYTATKHEGVERLAYVTVGTGLGVGIVNKGIVYGGKHHLEMGHVMVKRHISDLDYAGYCPFHGDCLEGLVCGPSIIERYGKKLSDIAPSHVTHDVIAHYLAQLVVGLSYSHAPDRIIFGGGVMGTDGLMQRIRELAAVMLGNYPASAPSSACLEDYIQSPKLGADSGLLGAILLASGTVIRA